jgi:hypothetical protein
MTQLGPPVGKELHSPSYENFGHSLLIAKLTYLKIRQVSYPTNPLARVYYVQILNVVGSGFYCGM